MSAPTGNSDPAGALPPDLRSSQSGTSVAAARAGLLRVNTAAAVIVVLVIALATAAVMTAIASARHAARASEAQARAHQELWESYLSQARAGRLSGVMGKRREGLAAIKAAARMGPSLELRNEAIAHLALRDLNPAAPFITLSNAITTVINHSGSRAAIADSDRRLRIFDLTATQEVLNVRPSPSVRPLVYSPDDALIAGIDSRNQLALVDAESGAALWRYANWRAMDFMPHSRIAAVLNQAGRKIRFLNSTTGVEELPLMELNVTATDLAISPTGEFFSVALADRVEVHSFSNSRLGAGKPHRVLPLPSQPSSMAWGGDWLAVGEHAGEIELYHVPDGRSYRLRGHKALVSNLTFDRRGDLLVSVAYDGSSMVWNTYSGRNILSTTAGFGLRFTEDNRSLVFRTRNAIGAWAVSHPQGYREIHLADSAASIFHADFSDDGDYIAVAKGDGLRLVYLPSGSVVAKQPMVRGRSAHFLPDGRLLTCGDFRLSIWPLEFSGSASGEAGLGSPQHIELPSRQHVDLATLNASRTHVALPVSDTSAVALEIARPANRVLITNTPNPKITVMSPDGRWLVTGTFHGSKGTRLWDARTGAFIRDLVPDNSAVHFNPDPRRRMLLVAGNREYVFFDTDTWQITHRMPTESAGDLPNAAAFTADGLTVALTIARTAVQLIDVQTFSSLATLSGPENNVVSWLTFDRAGEMLAAVMTSDVVELWNLREIRRQLQPLGLDWSTPAAAAMPGPAARAPAFVSVGRLSGPLVAGIIGAVILVIACAGFVLVRQRRLLAQYFQAGSLVEQRNRELSLAQAEIMHSQKMKALGTLAAGIAHDFNNLLSVIRMSNKLIAREAPRNGDIIENTQEIEHAVRQGKTVVRSMLGYSRDAGDAGGPVSLAELVEDTVGLLSRQFLSGIALQLEIEPNLAPVPTSRGKLEQVLLNLIVNASEAMDGKGSLRIAVRTVTPATIAGPVPFNIVLRPRPSSSYVEIAVADSGPGVEPAVLPRIFEPFFTTKHVGATRGTGLGLSMVHTMAEQEGIGIAVETSLGKGTVFRLFIPAT